MSPKGRLIKVPEIMKIISESHSNSVKVYYFWVRVRVAQK